VPKDTLNPTSALPSLLSPHPYTLNLTPYTLHSHPSPPRYLHAPAPGAAPAPPPPPSPAPCTPRPSTCFWCCFCCPLPLPLSRTPHQNHNKTLLLHNKTAVKAALRAARPAKYFTGTAYVRLVSADAAADVVAAQVSALIRAPRLLLGLRPVSPSHPSPLPAFLSHPSPLYSLTASFRLLFCHRMSENTAGNAQFVSIGGHQHAVLPAAADPDRDAQRKQVKASKPRQKVPHYHPLSSYKWRKRENLKRARREMQGQETGRGDAHTHAPAEGFKLLA